MALAVQGAEKESMFFFEKKNQKTFILWASRAGQPPHQVAEVFCFFFSKKKAFLWRGAGEGNRTLVCSLGSCRSTIELHPRPRLYKTAPLTAQSTRA